MSLLIINAGSSSLRIAHFATDREHPVRLGQARYDLQDNDALGVLRTFIEQENIKTPFTVAHRFVHGGAKFINPLRVTPEIISQLRNIVPLAPLHNPFALGIIELMEQEYGNNAIQIAVFDTAFFHDLPLAAKTYALPVALCRQHGLYRYGFHGFAHESLYHQWRQLSENQDNPSRVITIQLGSGCSISALRAGKPLDTSMGFTPLEGLVMGTRSGDVDAGLLLYLQRELGYTPEQLDHVLNEQSGLMGLSGESADMRQLIDNPADEAKLAVEIFCYRVRKYIGSYLAVLGGADAIVMGGGIGENMSRIRAGILHGMQWCGIRLDEEKNRNCKDNACISEAASAIEVWRIKTDEEQLIAEAACTLLNK